jgi:hypothetical protein
VDREFKSCPQLINNNQPQQLNVKLIGGGAQGFESPSSPTSFGISSDVNWQQFHNFLLQRMTAKTAEDRLRHAKQYVSLLTNDEVISNRDYSCLLQLSPNKRIHIMKALSCLARFTGRAEQWRSIRKQYQLSWSTGTEKIDAFTRFFD